MPKLLKCAWCGKTIKGEYFTAPAEGEIPNTEELGDAKKRLNEAFLSFDIERATIAYEKAKQKAKRENTKVKIYKFCSLKCRKEYSNDDTNYIVDDTKDNTTKIQKSEIETGIIRACPYCHESISLKANKTHVGSNVQCPACKKIVKISLKGVFNKKVVLKRTSLI